MPGSRVEAPLLVRLDYVRRRLMTAFDFATAFVALCRADQEVLRALEADYVFMPGPYDNIRERIARAHVAAVRTKVPMSTQRVKPAAVLGWAAQALEAGLDGVTDHDPDLGGQYRVRLLEAGPRAHLEVTTLQGHDPREFLLALTAREIR